LVASLCVPPQSHAQEGISVEIKPPLIEEQLDPGGTAEGVLYVTNQNGGTQTYYLGTKNVVGMTDAGRPEFGANDDSSDPLRAAAWIEPLKTEITLNVGEMTEVPYRISVPENAGPGGYQAALFVTREADVTSVSGAGVGFQVGSLISLRITGEAVEDLKVKEFSTDATFYQTPTVQFLTRVENTGTVPQQPQGVITITDMLGNTVGKVNVNEQGGRVIQRDERVYETAWSSDSFTLGKYTAMASLVYGETDRRTVTRSVTFWIIPLKEVGMVVGGIILLLLLMLWGVKSYVRRELRKAGHTATKQAKAGESLSLGQRMTKTILRLILLLVLAFVVLFVFYS